LDVQRRGIAEKLALAEQMGQREQAEELRQQLDDIERVIIEKRDPLLAAIDELAAGMQEGFASMFEGDWEGMREGFRSMLAVLAGMLEKLASAAVTKMVLDWLVVDPTSAALPFFVKAGLIPAIQAAASGLVHAVMGPVLGGLLSFASGGRVDNPTLAVIGDAGRSRPGANTEWVTRDIDLMSIARTAAVGVVEAERPLFKAILQRLDILCEKEYRLGGTDLFMCIERTRAGIKRRSRT
jgi:hypothetical protein